MEVSTKVLLVCVQFSVWVLVGLVPGSKKAWLAIVVTIRNEDEFRRAVAGRGCCVWWRGRR